ncbi:MAG: hypothetical protein F4135_05425 [Acidimicrobiia bacterium]|nr:hypothetical protein [Acidimicrobiia bacterium]
MSPNDHHTDFSTDDTEPYPSTTVSQEQPLTKPTSSVRAAGFSVRTTTLIVALVSAITLLTMAPHLLLVANTPTGGDMGAHVLGPAYLRDVLLPSGRIMGWSNSWFAGFPIFYFYFPLPSLVIVGLDLVLPYGVAFKLVTVMGLVALAPATFFLVRSMGFSRPVAMIGAASGGLYAFMETPTPNIFGGTIASSLAGEFAYSWSFAFSLLYLGCLIRAVHEDRRYFVWAAVTLAGTALCHVIPTIGVVIASLFVLVGRSAWWERLRTGSTGDEHSPTPWWMVPGTWAVGFLLAAFWALPLIIRLGYTTDMNWQPLTGFDELVPVEFWPIAILGLFGLAVALRRTGRAVALAGLTLIPVPAFFLLSQGAKLWNGRTLPHWYFGLHVFAGIGVGLLIISICRRLPERAPKWLVQSGIVALVLVLVLGPDIGGSATITEGDNGWVGWIQPELVIDRISGPDLLLMAAGIVMLLLLANADQPSTRTVLPVVAALSLVGTVFLGVATDQHYAAAWARWNYGGYEGKTVWPEYEGLMSTINDLPPGRVQWEANSDLNQYGTPMSPMLFPYWTEGSHPSMEGLFFESSITTPFHFLNAAELSYSPSNPIPGLTYYNRDFRRGARHMDLFNVSYYVAFTDQAKEMADQHPDFTLIAESEPFRIFALPESSLVVPAVNQPWVYEGTPSRLFSSMAGIFRAGTEPHFVDVALDWYQNLGMLDQWIAAGGPDDWERTNLEMEGTRVPIPAASEVEISDVVLQDHRIAFQTSGVGIPHLVKVSYFPNWQAYGAEGPWRVTPSFMVVVPTEDTVELVFENTWVERVGAWATLSGLIGLLSWGLISLSRRFRRNRIAPDPSLNAPNLREPATAPEHLSEGI